MDRLYLGSMRLVIADGLAVVLGEAFKDKIPFALLRYASAVLFCLMCLAILTGALGFWALG